MTGVVSRCPFCGAPLGRTTQFSRAVLECPEHESGTDQNAKSVGTEDGGIPQQ